MFKVCTHTHNICKLQQYNVIQFYHAQNRYNMKLNFQSFFNINKSDKNNSCN